MKSKTIALIIASVFLLTLAFVVVPAASAADPSSQAPTLPAQFHGTLYNNEGKPFPAGTVITAEVNGITSTFTLTEDGKIGGSGTFDEKFLISGVNDGDVVTLKIEGTDVVTTFTYDGKTAGNAPELTLVVDSAIPTPVPTPTPATTSTGGSDGSSAGTGGSSGGSGIGSGGDGGIVTPIVTPTATVAETTPATAATGAEAASPASTVTTDVQPTATTAKPTEAAKTPVPLSGLMIGGMAVAAIALRRK